MTPPAGKRSGAATLNDVAHAAGVSLATASRVLNGSTRRVADDYRVRVEAAAQELGYTANLSAQATARGTSGTIALLVADIADPYFGLVASGVARGADEQGLVMTIAITEREVEREARLLRTLRGQRPRGIIFAASRGAESTSEALLSELTATQQTGSQIVMLGSGPEGPGIRSVTVDNLGASRRLGESLAALGYRRAVALAGEPGVRTSDERLAGFTAGIGGVDRVYRGGLSRDEGYRLAEEALAAGLEPGTVMFAVTDVMAIGAMSAVHAAGRTVGADVAVAGFDDISTARDVTPALTTVKVPVEEVGYRALQAATDPEWAPADDPVELTVLLRGSTPSLLT